VRAIFFAPLYTGPGAHSASCTMFTGSFPGVNLLRRGVDLPPTSKAEDEERVELHLWAFVASSRMNITYVVTFRTVQTATYIVVKTPSYELRRILITLLYVEILDDNNTQFFLGECGLVAQSHFRSFIR